MPARLPIFLISFNRADYLGRVIKGYRRQNMPVEIIIHDFGSDDPATLEMLAKAERDGAAVVRDSKISDPDELDRVDRSVQHYFRDRPPAPYAVSDCDIDLGEAAPNSLETYVRLLDRLPRAECAGPMLRIRDIPRDYPLFNHVINRHCEQFWRHEPQWIDLGAATRLAYIEAPIDTTLAVHRSGEPFRRLKKGIRVYHPHEAAHLDWYQSRANWITRSIH